MLSSFAVYMLLKLTASVHMWYSYNSILQLYQSDNDSLIDNLNTKFSKEEIGADNLK